MQLTIDIPERLVQRLETERGNLAEIIEGGLRLRDWVGASALAQELGGGGFTHADAASEPHAFHFRRS